MDDYEEYFQKAEITTHVHAKNTVPSNILSKISKENISQGKKVALKNGKLGLKTESLSKKGILSSIPGNQQENTKPVHTPIQSKKKVVKRKKTKKWMKRI